MSNTKQIHKPLIILLLSFSFCSGYAQTGGNHDFKFLTLTNSARSAALGSYWLPIKDGDVNNTLFNPSLINSDVHHSFAMNYINDFGGINYGYAIYSHTFDKVGSFAASMQFLNYGTMKEADVAGNTYGDFSANELSANIGWGRELTPHWSIGANLKFAYSSMYADYNAFGLGVDVAGSYFNAEKRLTVSLVANNIGYVLEPYSQSEDSNRWFPFAMSLGVSQRLEHIPLRYVLIYNNIEKWDLRGNSQPTTTIDPITGETTTKKNIDKFGDNLMRHLTFGAEFTIAKVINLRGGYNYGRRQELKTETRKGMMGFSWGLGLNFKRFSIDYGRSMYHLAGSPNYFTFSANIDRLIAKRSPRAPKSYDEKD
ncbi:MAG: type IX secretion system protein PorQ [Bacteroidales bacterium]|nr:type IX secretion system protein PorQ [Bacteroidales bacterium]